MVKKIGKEWYQIKAPKLFNETVIGETLSFDPDEIKGRIIEATLPVLLDNVSKYYVKLFFKVKDVEGKNAFTKFDGHECTRDFIARIVRKMSQRIDTNDILQLKDGKLRVKTIAVTNRVVSESIATSIRKNISVLLAKYTENMSIDDFVKSFVSDSVQKTLREQLNKIYPLRTFEIRKSKVI